jgi:hypothetical protein
LTGDDPDSQTKRHDDNGQGNRDSPIHGSLMLA